MGMPIKKLVEALREAVIGDDRRRAPAHGAADADRREYESCRAIHASAVAFAYRHDLVPPLFSQVRQDRISASGHFAFADEWAILIALRFRNAPLNTSRDPDLEKGLDRFEEDAEAIADAHETYALGRCHILAIALHRMTGLAPRAALTHDLDLGELTCLEHAWVDWGDGLCLDIRGLQSVPDLSRHYRLIAPNEVITLDEAFLARIGSGDQATPVSLAHELDAAIPAALDALSLGARKSRLLGLPVPDAVARRLEEAADIDALRRLFRSPGASADPAPGQEP